MGERTYTALVLAASRGNLDPLAQAGGVSHKCFILINGRPMLQRVVEAVMASPRVKRPSSPSSPIPWRRRSSFSPLCRAPMPSTTCPARDNIATSVAAVAREELLPLIVTTGDNALHTEEMVTFFCDALDGVTEDAALGLTPASYVLEKYPEGNRAFHRFRDGAFSSCNLYAILTPEGHRGRAGLPLRRPVREEAEAVDRGVWHVALLLYRSRLFKLRTVLRTLSRGIGVKTAPVLMPFAEGPIDVDRQVDWDLANRIVAAREGQA